MGKKLYVGSIPFQATEDDLRELFSKAGEVESVKIITDMQSGQSKGFGFVEMASEEDATKAIADLNGATLMERTIVVNEARPQQPRDRRGGPGGGRGGFDKRRGGPGGGGFNRGKGTGRGRR
ncbi:MAG: RNA-binding protein [Nitrospiraceae bacterium]|nr:MAG: RNA-binding protein [Nitrospiraceae bacterium]